MKRSQQPQAPASRTVQDVSSELIAIEQSISDGLAEPAVALQAIVTAFSSLHAVSGTFIALCDGRQMRCIASAGAAPMAGALIQNDGILGDCLQTGRFLRCQRASEDPRVDPVLRSQSAFESMIAVPVKSRGSASGVLAVFSREADGLDQDYVFVLGSAANLAAVIATRLPVVESQEDNPQPEPEDTDSMIQSTSRLSEAPPVIAPGSTIDLTALSLSELLAPVATPPAESQQVPATLLEPAPVLQRFRTTSAVRNAAIVAVGLLLFSTALFPAIRGRQKPPSPKVAANTISQVKGSTEETIGRPSSADGSALPSRMAGGDLRKRVAPVYPQSALRDGMQGQVNVIITIDEAGVVSDTRIVSGDRELANAAISAISHWRFAPFLSDGRPVSVNLPVVVAFHCSGSDDSVSTAAALTSSARQIR